MFDAYLLLTPLLVLGVLALVRFIGCDVVWRIDGVPDIAPPKNVVATASDSHVTLTWDPVADAGGYDVQRGGATGGPYPVSHKLSGAQTTTFVDGPLVNGQTVFYVISSLEDGKDGGASSEVSATPGRAFVVQQTLGMLRNDFNGTIGMLIQVGAGPITAIGIGRIFLAGNNGTHTLKLVDANSGVDLPNGATTISLPSATIAPGDFVYGVLPAPIVLVPNMQYYVVSEEVSGGDQWSNLDCTVITTTDASVVSAVYGDVASYVRGGGAGQTYGPVDLLLA
jgi:hypothetical protein